MVSDYALGCVCFWKQCSWMNWILKNSLKGQKEDSWIQTHQILSFWTHSSLRSVFWPITFRFFFGGPYTFSIFGIFGEPGHYSQEPLAYSWREAFLKENWVKQLKGNRCTSKELGIPILQASMKHKAPQCKHITSLILSSKRASRCWESSVVFFWHNQQLELWWVYVKDL